MSRGGCQLDNVATHALMDHFRNGARVAGVGEVDNKHVITLASGQDIGTCQGHGAQGKGRGQGGPQEKAARGKQGGYRFSSWWWAPYVRLGALTYCVRRCVCFSGTEGRIAAYWCPHEGENIPISCPFLA